MIDLSDIQFMYSKEEVDAYLQANQVSVEDLLQALIEAVAYSKQIVICRLSQKLVCLFRIFELVPLPIRLVVGSS